MYPPKISRPDYIRGMYCCSSCGTGYYMADKCPSYGTSTSKEGGKRENNVDKPRVNVDFREGDWCEVGGV